MPYEDEDVNMDGVVNIFDIIFVQNRLCQDPFTGDNYRADVDQDGHIGASDLYFICKYWEDHVL